MIDHRFGIPHRESEHIVFDHILRGFPDRMQSDLIISFSQIGQAECIMIICGITVQNFIQHLFLIQDDVHFHRKSSSLPGGPAHIECKIQNFPIRRDHHAHHEDFYRDLTLIQFLHSIGIIQFLHLGSGKRHIINPQIIDQRFTGLSDPGMQ